MQVAAATPSSRRGDRHPGDGQADAEACQPREQRAPPRPSVHLFDVDFGARDEEEHAHANLAEHGDRLGEGSESQNVRPDDDAQDEQPDDVGHALTCERGQQGCDGRSGGD